MTGKPRENRSTVATKSVGLRLTEGEFALLWAVVESTNQRLRKQGMPAYMTGSRLIKMLVEREAERLGVLEGGPDAAVPIMDVESAQRVLAAAAGDDPRRPVPRPGSRRRRKQP